uniref:hAT-like transposase RNase-H fold domain-containing protein n=1 Tax=Nicotiana tabacum TaxID=4097 RepID=A0A1S3YZT1_TOBAC|nr:PREDICTED: uncharacterized protein LOC107781443 [Nicotiana tabacum]
MAHILNLIVQDGLKKIDISVKCVRQAVRWNFTYLMLEITQNFEKAFDKLHLFYDGFSTHLCMHVCEDGNVAGPFVCDDWVNMRNVIKFLERFHKLSEKVSDPHNKLEYVGFALEKMFGEEPGKKLTAEVDAYLNSLFGEYKKKYSKGCYLQSSLSKSTSFDDTSDSSSGNVRTKYVRTKQLLKRQKEDSESVGAKSELERYIGEGQEPLSDDSNDFKILDW